MIGRRPIILQILIFANVSWYKYLVKDAQFT